MRHPETPAPAELNREVSRLRAAIAERDARIRELEEALEKVRGLAADRERFVRLGPRGFLACVSIADAALSRKGTP